MKRHYKLSGHAGMHVFNQSASQCLSVWLYVHQSISQSYHSINQSVSHFSAVNGVQVTKMLLNMVSVTVLTVCVCVCVCESAHHLLLIQVADC